MGDSKITDFTDGSPLQATDELVIARAGANNKIPGSQILNGLVSKIFDSTLGADAASIDSGAASIPAGYGALLIYIVARTADAGATGSIQVTVNNDTSSIYDYQAVFATSTGPAQTNNEAQASWATITHGSGGSSGYPGVWEIQIPSYDQTTFWKVGAHRFLIPDATAGNQFAGVFALGYRATTAISRLKVAGATANLKAGSRLLIYGLPG